MQTRTTQGSKYRLCVREGQCITIRTFLAVFHHPPVECDKVARSSVARLIVTENEFELSELCESKKSLFALFEQRRAMAVHESVKRVMSDKIKHT